MRLLRLFAAAAALWVSGAPPVTAEFIPGDVNDDGVFDAADATVLRRALAGLGPGMTQQCLVPVCGDAMCDPGEDCAGCFADCGACPENPAAIYVSIPANGGADIAGCGPQAAPCATIAFGLARASATAAAEVLVSSGTYAEDVALVDGIDLLGGFDALSWAPAAPSDPTILMGLGGSGHRMAVHASGISASTHFDGFTVFGAPATSDSANSYAIYVSGATSSLEITGNTIFAGTGGPGFSAGSALGGADGTAGGGRADDPSGYDAFVAVGAGFCDSSNDRQLANGGAGFCGGDNVSGGSGGGNRCTPMPGSEFSASDGFGGFAAFGGAPGGAGGDAGNDGELTSGGATCVLPAAPMQGADGLDGGRGDDGGVGAGCAISTGAVGAGHWVAAAASSGNAGVNGSGGGGGGGGGGGFCSSCAENKDRLGGHGGGGGSGGCGGEGGSSGLGGGGSFGIFVVGGTAPVIEDNAIFVGGGGTGGDGADGGVGGVGGPGGAGGECPGNCFCFGAAGAGGRGGDGGHGGGGGGGCGGAAFGIYTSGIGTPAYCLPATGNAISGGVGGAGGRGGLSLGSSGTAGATGAVGDCSFN